MPTALMLLAAVAHTITRRGAIAGVAAAAASRLPASARAESPLWPREGLFPDCPSDGGSCVSSQDDRPAVWDNPWIFDGALADDFGALQRVIRKLGGRVVASDDDRYLRAEWEDKGIGGLAVDEAEFFFAPNDTLVQFRAVRRGGAPDFGANRKRLEKTRIALGWEKVPVLRNRRRALVVAESPFDSFGPATSDREMEYYTMPAREQLYGATALGDKDPKSPQWQAPKDGLFEWWIKESDDRVKSR